MDNLKLKLFNFKNTLSLEQEEVSQIVEAFLHNFDNLSEKEVVGSLSERLEIYTYDSDVKSLVESMNDDMLNNSLIYDLKDLYKKLQRQNTGEILRHPMQVVLNTINEADNDARMVKILNELSIYDWINEVKHFMLKFKSTPQERMNLKHTGKADSVYTIVETVDNGHMVYIKDRWFLLEESKIVMCDLSEKVTDEVKLKKLRMLEESLRYADFRSNRIDYHIDENLVISLATDSKKVFINDQEIEAEMSLENIFSSPIVPMLKRNFYPVIAEAAKNLDKFIELDVVTKVTNIINVYNEAYCFNHNGKMYVYNCDKRVGTSLFEYASTMELINDIQRQFDMDVTYFYENNLTKEQKTKFSLEEKEKEISLDIKAIKENIESLNVAISVTEESEGLKSIMEKLVITEQVKKQNLKDIKEKQLELTKALVK